MVAVSQQSTTNTQFTVTFDSAEEFLQAALAGARMIDPTVPEFSFDAGDTLALQKQPLSGGPQTLIDLSESRPLSIVANDTETS